MCSVALAHQAAVLCCAAAAVVHRCCAGTPSKIQPSLSAMKLTAWARLVAPATRAGRSTTSCTRWSAPSGGGAQTSAAAQVEDLARADRRLHGRTQAGRGRAAVMSEVAAAGGTARRSCIRVSRYLHQYPVQLTPSQVASWPRYHLTPERPLTLSLVSQHVSGAALES